MTEFLRKQIVKRAYQQVLNRGNITITMRGVITRKHFFKVWRHIGFRQAVRLLSLKQTTALQIIMS